MPGTPASDTPWTVKVRQDLDRRQLGTDGLSPDKRGGLKWVDATLARSLLLGVHEADFVREC